MPHDIVNVRFLVLHAILCVYIQNNISNKNLQFFSESTYSSKMAEWLGAVMKSVKTDARKTMF